MSVTYTAVLPAGEHTVDFLTSLLTAERARRGTRAGTRAVPARDQAILVLRWFLDDTRMRQAEWLTARGPRRSWLSGKPLTWLNLVRLTVVPRCVPSMTGRPGTDLARTLRSADSLGYEMVKRRPSHPLRFRLPWSEACPGCRLMALVYSAPYVSSRPIST